MFCRWFNHQNLNSKFRTVFCSDSSDSYPDIESIARENLCHTGQRETHIKNRELWWISTLQAEFKVCHIDKWKRVTMNFNWMFKFLSVSSSQVWPRTIPLTADRTWRWLQTFIPFYNSFREWVSPSLSSPRPPSSPVNGTGHSCVDWICVQSEIQHHLLALIIMWRRGIMRPTTDWWGKWERDLLRRLSVNSARGG